MFKQYDALGKPKKGSNQGVNNLCFQRTRSHDFVSRLFQNDFKIFPNLKIK